MDEKLVLQAIPSTEPASWFEFVRALGPDAPAKGDRAGWWKVFEALHKFENLGLVEIEWDGDKVESLILTEAGAARVRETQAARG